jgi:hypothetical protein
MGNVMVKVKVCSLFIDTFHTINNNKLTDFKQDLTLSFPRFSSNVL